MSRAKKEPASARRIKTAAAPVPVEPPVPYDRYCQEVGTYQEALGAALAPTSEGEAPQIVIEALDQLGSALFMLRAALGDPYAEIHLRGVERANDAPVNPKIPREFAQGIHGRIDALQTFIKTKLVVRWRYEDDNEAEVAQ